MPFIATRTYYSFDANLGLNIFEKISKILRILLSFKRLDAESNLMYIWTAYPRCF